MTMKPCKHLDYEGEYLNCEIKTCEPEYPEVRYWNRNKVPYEGAAIKVQFCKKRGRVPGIFQCYNVGEMPCYELDD